MIKILSIRLSTKNFISQTRKGLAGTALLLMALVATSPAWANLSDPNSGKTSDVLPHEIKDVEVVEKLGQNLDLNLKFQNESGELVPLAKYIDGNKPTILTIVYFNCPSLCNFHLNGLMEVFKNNKKGTIGKDYNVIAVSMEPTETPELARRKKETYIEALGQVGAENGWHFLVGDQANITALANQVGFKYKWNEARKEYSHPAVAYVISPTGMLSRYLYGIEFSADTLHLSLVEASEGKIGNIIDRIVLFCFQFDPSKNKYTLYAFNLMRAGAVLTLALLALVLIPLWMKEKQGQALGA
jgi:protein SCO1/2